MRGRYAATGSSPVVGLLAAAGSGERLSRGVPKAFVPVLGTPMLDLAVRGMARAGIFDLIVVAVPADRVEEARAMLDAPGAAFAGCSVVAGGPTRQDSVRLALEAVPDHAGIVVCHDAARPLAGPELFGRVLDGVRAADGAIPVIPSADTIKRLRGGLVAETLPRDEIGLAQTPQAFRAEALRDSHRRAASAGGAAVDDAMLLEAAGYRVVAVEGDPSNFKITTPEDLRRAEALLAAAAEPSP